MNAKPVQRSTRLTLASLVALGLALLLGCGGADGRIEVTGKVTMDGDALSDVDVRFIPDSENMLGNGGVGRTDQNGVYTLKTPQGHAGIEPGTYRVVLSRLLTPDGKPLPADSEIDPMSSNAKESLLPRYSDEGQSTLTAKVTDGAEPIDFRLGSKKAP